MIRHFLIRTLCCATVFASSLCLRAEVRMMVMTDMHVYDTTLFDTCSLFRSYADSEPKLVEHSAELFDSAVLRIIEARPDVLLIPGDMTKDGEQASHQYVAAGLARLKQAGIRTLVVPGNHDIANPASYSYLNGQKTSVPSISESDFVSIYGPYGYDSAVMRQPNGLSYMAYVSPDLAVICLNSTQPNGTSRVSAGGLDEATLSWAETASAQAHATGHYVIGMMHHQIVEHFDKEGMVGPTYLANQADGYTGLDTVQARLIQAKIGMMLTGHFHIHSIQHVTTEDGELFDVSTGALCSYASPLRTIVFEDSVLSITTDTIGMYQELGKVRNGNTVRGAINSVSRQYYKTLIDKVKETINDSVYVSRMNLPKSSSELASGINTYMFESLLPILNSLSLGDEEQHDPFMLLLACKAGFENYWTYVQNNATSTNAIATGKATVKVATAKAAIVALMDQELKSVLYNWVGEETNVVPDWTLDITLPTVPYVDPSSLEQVTVKPSARSGCYTIDGRLLPDDMQGHLPAGVYVVNGEKVIVR